MKSYKEMLSFDSFLDRVRYLIVRGKVGEETFGNERMLNQILYRSPEWRSVRRRAIIRDEGCDLAFNGRDINDKIIVHHINPITVDDILNRDPKIFDLDNLVCCSNSTHQAIHYGDLNLITVEYAERKPNDTCPWRKQE